MLLPKEDIELMEDIYMALRDIGEKHEVSLIRLVGATQVTLKRMIDAVLLMFEKDKEEGNGNGRFHL